MCEHEWESRSWSLPPFVGIFIHLLRGILESILRWWKDARSRGLGLGSGFRCILRGLGVEPPRPLLRMFRPTLRDDVATRPAIRIRDLRLESQIPFLGSLAFRTRSLAGPFPYPLPFPGRSVRARISEPSVRSIARCDPPIIASSTARSAQ